MPSQQPRNRTLARASLAAAVLAAAALLLSACGSASRSTASPMTTVATANASVRAQTLQSKFVATVKKVSSSVVEVETPAGLGSGVVFDTRGDIVTNDHVVGSYKKFQVTDSTGKRRSATLVGTFVPDDLAVIHVAGANLEPLALGNSSRLQVGEITLAVGNPLGLQSSVTNGIVTALGRTVTEQNGSAPAVDRAIVGFRRPDQVDPIVDAVNLELDDHDIATIEGRA
jgi:putative serine protease PepD